MVDQRGHQWELTSRVWLASDSSLQPLCCADTECDGLAWVGSGLIHLTSWIWGGCVNEHLATVQGLPKRINGELMATLCREISFQVIGKSCLVLRG